jgi:hypothetical protein
MKLKLIAILLGSLFISSCKTEVESYEVHKITKSGTTIDCKGSEFNKGENTEIRVTGPISNIVIKNCRLKGSIRVMGLGTNGEDENVKESSLKEGHTQRAQKAAPSNVLISNMVIEGVQRIPVYLSPGVTKTTIEGNRLIGSTDSTVVYLDAESGYNTIKNNIFNVEGSFTLRQFRIREVIAVDGSAHNAIIGNKFEKAIGGGVYLYRNCGEGGTIRHQAPQFNTISDNVFNLSGLHINNYGIWLGARNGNRLYCDADKGYKFGSSVDDGDFADNNIVRDNKFSGSDREIRNDGKNNLIK